MPSRSESVRLRVSEAAAADVGRGIARLDPVIEKTLRLEAGDAIEIRGTRSTVALVWHGAPQDAGKSCIRMDGTIRRNAGLGLDDMAEVRPLRLQPAQRIAAAPSTMSHWMVAPALVARALENRAVIAGDNIDVPVMGKHAEYVVTKTEPRGAVLVVPQTEIQVGEEAVEPAEARAQVSRVTYEDIGGLGEQVQRVREMIELPLRFPELFERLGVEPPKGVLLHGPPGTGKTLLAKAIANETNVAFFSVTGPELISKFCGESEERLRELFKKAEAEAPSIVFLDEIDSIAPKREEVTGEVERRVVAQLLALLDGLKSRGKVVVIGATNRPNALDPALRRPGRLDREIELPIPQEPGRYHILQIHTRGMPLEDDVDLKHFAQVSHGFVGADLAALAREAAMRAVRRILPDVDVTKDKIPPKVLERLRVGRADFDGAFRELEPSALREVYLQKPNVHWNQVGDLEEAKRDLREAIEWPLKYPRLVEAAKAKPARGILLFGPSGTGKTLLAKAVATESEANFISIKGPEFFSKWVGESERAVRETFRKARAAAPCIVFFDEIDALASMRGASLGDSNVGDRVVSQLLSELDGIEPLNGVVVLAATNRPELVDPALLRPGRFDRLIEIPMPNETSRLAILRIHLPQKLRDVSPNELAKRTEGWSGADLEALCREATSAAMRRHLTTYSQHPEDPKALADFIVTADHFEEAFERVRPKERAELVRRSTERRNGGVEEAERAYR